MNHPGFPSNGLLLDKRDIDPTDFGRVCCVESPQGKRLGISLYLSKDARVNEHGNIEFPCKDIRSNQVVWVEPNTEASTVTALGTKSEAALDDVTFVKKPEQEVALGRVDSVSHHPLSDHGFLGYSASLVPFIQHNDGGRALMGANMMKQAILLLKPEPPLVKTGIEAVIAEKYAQPENPFIVDNQLCLGTNLLVGYMVWDLLNYEDGIVINERLVRNDTLTHVHTENVVLDQKYNEIIKYIMPEGSRVRVGDRLIEKERIIADVSPKHLYLGGVKSHLENCSLYAYEGVDGVLKSKEVLTKNLPDGVARRIILKIEKHVQIQTGDKLTGRHGNKGVVSAILPEYRMPYFFTETNTCTDENCPVERPHTHLDALLNPLGITGRMNVGQLYETALGWIAKNNGGITVEPFNREWSFEKIQSVMADMNLRSKQKVYFYEAETEIEAGDITVGYQYMMKLSHLAADKITVRSRNNNKYSKITGQPVVSLLPQTEMVNIWKNRRAKKTKPQRIGEMELWALQGHSAWNMIDEFLFLKSDAEEARSDFFNYIRT